MPHSNQWVTVYALFYGDRYDLHERMYRTILVNIPSDEARVELWCSQVCEQTKRMLEDYVRTHTNAHVTFTNSNLGKYRVMYELFHSDEYKPSTPWVIWFDDDAHAMNEYEWWNLVRRTTHDVKEDVGAFGMVGAWKWHKGQEEWAKSAPWYKGKPWKVLGPMGGVGAVYALGGFTALRTKCIEELDWPDTRLVHGGQGDVMLGAALHQNGYTVFNQFCSIVPTARFRRGVTEDWVDGAIVRREPTEGAE